MNEIRKNISVKSGGLPVIIDYTQGTNAIPIILRITDWEIPSGASARIYAEKPSGAIVYNGATISLDDNSVKIQPTTQMFAEEGRAEAQIQIAKGENVLNSFPIIFRVAKNIIKDSAVESTNEFTILDTLIQSAQEEIKKTKSAAQAANTAANLANQKSVLAGTAAEEANAAAKNANLAATQANNAANNANSATTNANAATTAANKSKADADAAAQRANKAAEACEGIKDNTRITALENEVAQMSIGGTNLLRNTRDMSGYGISSNVTLSKDSEGFTVASFARVSTPAWNSVRVIPIQFSAVRGKTVTASLEVRSADYVQLNAEQKQGLNISFDLCSASSLARTKCRAIAKYTEDLSEDWKKITVTAALSDEFFLEGTGTIDDTARFFLQVFNYSVYRMEIRKLKLEVGTKATDWSPAPEDTDAAIAAMGKAVLLAAHPVGSIYTSINDTNPAELFGGTWEQINDVFLLASGKRNAGETGGDEEVTLTNGQMPTHTHTGPSHTHTLASHAHTATSASAGAHTHTVNRSKSAASGSDKYAAQYTEAGTTHSTSSEGAHSHTITVNGSGQLTTGAAGTGNTGSAGSGKAHNNMPPYKVVNAWIRVA